MLVALVVTPILLRELGAARLGASRAVMDWAGYLVLLELGLNGALMPLLGRALAKGDQTQVKAVMSAGFRSYVMVTIPMLLGAVVLAVSVTRLIRIDPALHDDLRAASVLAAVPLLLMPLSPLRALAESNQRGYVLNLFLVAQSLTVAISSVLLARAGWGIKGQTLAIAIGAAVFGVLVVGDALRGARGMLPSHPLQRQPEQSREIWQLNKPTLIINVCGRVGLLTDNIVIGSILSAPLIVPFLMTQRLAQIAQGQLLAVGSASWAGLIQLHVRGEAELFRVRFLELNQLVTVLGLAVLMPIAAYDHAFVRLWVGESSYAGGALASLAACNALVLALAALWGWLFAGTGQAALLVPIAIASVTVNLLVSVGFTWLLADSDPRRALLGPVLGTATALLSVNLPAMAVMLRKHFEIPISALLRSVGAPLSLGMPYGVVVLWIGQRFPPSGWLSLALHMACAASFFAGLSWLVLLSPQDRGRWLVRLRLALGR